MSMYVEWPRMHMSIGDETVPKLHIHLRAGDAVSRHDHLPGPGEAPLSIVRIGDVQMIVEPSVVDIAETAGRALIDGARHVRAFLRSPPPGD